MNDAILLTKIRIPSPPRNSIPRTGLLGRHAEYLAYPLILVSAPAGFGKTVLAAEFLGALGEHEDRWRGAWLSLDADDDDPVRFWASMAASLDKAASGEKSSPFAGLASTEGSLLPSIAEMSAAILNAAASLQTAVLLVLDDFHSISSPVILGSFATFAERLPEQLHIMLLTRTDPRLPLPRFRARGIMTEIRSDSLRFDPGETESFLDKILGARITREQSQRIGAKTEGWAAGLQMAALSASRCADTETFVRNFSGSDRFILEFLVEEVLAGQTTEVRDFLFASSALDRFCAPLLDSLLDVEGGAGTMLARLDSENLFLVRLDDGGSWFRYHHLFSGALRERAGSGGTFDERNFLRKAALWHEKNGDTEAAVGLLLRAGDRQGAAALLEGIAYSYLARGERATLAAFIAQIGEKTVFGWQELAEASGWEKVFSGDAEDTEAYLSRLEDASRKENGLNDRDSLRGAAAAMRAFTAVQKGLTAEAELKAAEAERLLGADRLFARNIIAYVHVSCLRMRARYSEAMSKAEDFMTLATSWGDAWCIMMASFEASLTARMTGQLRKAEKIYFEAMAGLRQRGIRSFGSACKVHGNYAEILYERNMLAELDGLLAEYLDGGTDWVLPTDILAVLFPVIKTRIAQGRLVEAEALLGRSSAIIRTTGGFPRLVVNFRDLRARFAIAAGRPEIEQAPEYPAELEAVNQAARATDIRMAIALGENERAAAGAAILAGEAKRDGAAALYIEAKALEAAALAAARDNGSAMEALSAALEAGQAESFIRVFVDSGPCLEKLLAACLKQERNTQAGTDRSPYVRQILASFPDERQGAAEKKGQTSAREREVLALLSRGLGNRDIAARLFISEATVKTHVHHLAEKLDASSRGAIVVRARLLGII